MKPIKATNAIHRFIGVTPQLERPDFGQDTEQPAGLDVIAQDALAIHLNQHVGDRRGKHNVV
jgi:hypothetical protein